MEVRVLSWAPLMVNPSNRSIIGFWPMIEADKCRVALRHHGSKAKIFFQSDLMLTTVQPRAVVPRGQRIRRLREYIPRDQDTSEHARYSKCAVHCRHPP